MIKSKKWKDRVDKIKTLIKQQINGIISVNKDQNIKKLKIFKNNEIKLIL